MRRAREARSVPVGGRARTWVVQAPQVDGSAITVNGKAPRLEDNGSLSGLDPVAAEGTVIVPAKGIVFIAADAVRNPSCS